MKSLFAILLCLKIVTASYLPIVLWHGMGDSCCLVFSLGAFKSFLEKNLPGVYVYSIRVGKNVVEDYESGYFVNPNKQVEYVCEKLANDTKLQDGFNAIGFSQGGQFMRAVVQRCGHRLPPIKNLISLGGQHQGVYGLPNCGIMKSATCDYIRKLLNFAAYVGWVQNSLVQATYWHDPLDDTYKERSIFLADINNERQINDTYITNLNKLEHFVMVKYNNDTVVQPKESEWFGFYVPGQSKKTQTLQESDIYIQDRLGLKRMDKNGKLVFISFDGNHLHTDLDLFIKYILNPYLKVSSKYWYKRKLVED